MNSSLKINYELRPAKFVERKMLLTSLANICKHYKCDYQYIGFGGIAFTDFKLFHKELHINEMTSIEGGNLVEEERIKFNKPFSFINLEFGLSTDILPKINLEKPSIVWLDYDNVLDNNMFEDIAILFRKLPVGSVYLFTANRELKDRNTGEEYDVVPFKEKFGSLVPYNIKNKDFTGTENYKTIRKMLLSHIYSFINERNFLGDDLKFHQLYNFLYQENRGAKMFTFGGVIEKRGFEIEELGISEFDFLKTEEDAYRIKIPNLTNKETDWINKHFDTEKELVSSKIVRQDDLDKYKKTYKYLPNYYDVRI